MENWGRIVENAMMNPDLLQQGRLAPLTILLPGLPLAVNTPGLPASIVIRESLPIHYPIPNAGHAMRITIRKSLTLTAENLIAQSVTLRTDLPLVRLELRNIIEVAFHSRGPTKPLPAIPAIWNQTVGLFGTLEPVVLTATIVYMNQDWDLFNSNFPYATNAILPPPGAQLVMTISKPSSPLLVLILLFPAETAISLLTLFVKHLILASAPFPLNAEIVMRIPITGSLMPEMAYIAKSATKQQNGKFQTLTTTVRLFHWKVLMRDWNVPLAILPFQEQPGLLFFIKLKKHNAPIAIPD
jgi:hypothetical protein